MRCIQQRAHERGAAAGITGGGEGRAGRQAGGVALLDGPAAAAAGQVAGRTPFSINLSQCNPGNVATYFEPGATVDLGSGRLNNAAATSAATEVQLQLLGSNSLFLPVVSAGAGSTQANSQWVTVNAGGTADLNYFVEYYATGAATPGEVSSSVKYTIIYN